MTFFETQTHYLPVKVEQFFDTKKSNLNIKIGTTIIF